MAIGFRFRSLTVWRQAARLSQDLFGWADDLERHHRYRFAEQLRSAALSITNNLAEGSGSHSRREFAAFVNIARRSVFEVANMIYLLNPESEIPSSPYVEWLQELEAISRQLYSLRQSLLSQSDKPM